MTNQETSSYLKKLLINALIPFVIAIPLIIDSAFYSFIPPLDNFNHQIIWFCIGLISLGAMLFSGRSIYIGALKSFSGRTATMDTLIGIGTSAAWVYSMFVIFSPKLFPETARGLYFDTALVIIALINLGSYFETRARGKTSQAIKRLMRLQPKTARVLIEQQEEDIPIEDIQINQIIRIRPGEKIAVDGVI
ncbi:MAG: Cu+ exporting ATPase, partial [Gammaproteobacteria bacterium]